MQTLQIVTGQKIGMQTRMYPHIPEDGTSKSVASARIRVRECVCMELEVLTAHYSGGEVREGKKVGKKREN